MDNISSLTRSNSTGEANRALKPGDIFKKGKSTHEGDMGRDAFLKLLVTELRHQDPTSPMNDREFISQMAQFSSLEQMTSMNNTVQLMNKSARSGEAYALLGKRVDAVNPVTGARVSGTVSSIFYRDNEIRLTVNKEVIGLKDIYAVYPAEKEKEPDKAESGSTEGREKNSDGRE